MIQTIGIGLKDFEPWLKVGSLSITDLTHWSPKLAPCFSLKKISTTPDVLEL